MQEDHSINNLEAYVFDLYDGPMYRPIQSSRSVPEYTPEYAPEYAPEYGPEYAPEYAPVLERAEDYEYYKDNVFDIDQGEECMGQTPPCPPNCIDVDGRCLTVTNWVKSKNINEHIPMRRNTYYPYIDNSNVQYPELNEEQVYEKDFIDEFVPSTTRKYRSKDWRDYTLETPIRREKEIVDDIIPSTPNILI